GEPMVFKNARITYDDGIAVWTRAFGGEHRLQADGLMQGSVGSYYGGAVGADRPVGANLRVGGFIGAGQTRSDIDPTGQITDSNIVFGGVFAHYMMGASFLDTAVQIGELR